VADRLIDLAKQHIFQVLIAVAFGAWSISLFSMRSVVAHYLETQAHIEAAQESIRNSIAQINLEMAKESTERAQIRGSVNDHELRLRLLEKHAAEAEDLIRRER
jgi:uncharacterized membrane protein